MRITCIYEQLLISLALRRTKHRSRAFDITGSSIQLIERNKIFDCILPGVFSRIAEPDFELAWAEAETLRDSEFIALSSKYRSNRIKELLKSAVDQSVHYAILSHTWMRDTPGDVTFQDWAERERNPQGNTKITNFCKVAAQNHNVTLGWIDSVCINKESSSELDESIRSMYNWYRGASVCVTFLSDTYHISDAHRDSWFTRGWTLQELLAPVCSVFYNRSWDSLGSSSDADIQSVIAEACGITRKELGLSWSGAVGEIPFSCRLQMACGRQVTREEDTSYSLMGLLEVDILIAYGEGAGRAFSRLIRELFNTKKNVLDLFNRNYEHGENLLPSSLESYQHRIFYNHDHNGGTLLDDYLPLTPIISTPLGMRISVLLVPGITTDTEDKEKYAPKGVFSAKVPVTFFDETDAKFNVCVHLFDSRLYAREGLASLCAACSAKLPSRMDVISMMGIINFGADNDGHILLPERCFALRLTWNGLQQGNFFPVGKAAILPGIPATFMLNSKKELKVAKADLEKHGMQLVSWYL